MLTPQNARERRALDEAAPKPTQKPLDRLLSMKQTGEVLGVHIATVRRLIEAGKLIAVRVADRKIGIRASSIEQHMAANQLVGFKA
jgi:excisionase family DNA binding protein